MTVLNVTETTKDFSDKVSAFRTFQVTFDTAANGNAADAKVGLIGSTVMIPQYGTAHPDEANRFVRNIAARPMGSSRILYEVVVSYEGYSDDSGEEDPTAQDPVYEWGSYTIVEPFDRDLDGQEIVNSARRPFDPPLNRELIVSTCRASVLIAEGSWAPDTQRLYNGSMNSASVTLDGRTIGVETVGSVTFGKGKIAAFDVSQENRGGVIYRRVTLDVHIIDETGVAWWRRVLDAGFCDSDGNDFIDDNGNARSEPTLLDGAGAELGVGDPAVWLTFRDRALKSWSGLFGLFS
jgi:hypothetical protein